MPRSRNIKPGLCKNEHLASCSITARYLAAVLPCFADREGRLEDRPLKLKIEIFPADDGINVSNLLDELEKTGNYIARYEVENIKYIQILKFSKHQSPHVNEVDSTIPAPEQHDTGTGQGTTKEASAQAGFLIPDSLITDSLKKEDVPRKRGSGDAKKAFLEFADEHDAAAECEDYLALVKKKKAANSERAWDGRLKSMQALCSDGHPVKAVIAQSADSGWVGFFPLRKATHQPREAPKTGTKSSDEFWGSYEAQA